MRDLFKCAGDKGRVMKDNELVAGHLSPCVQLFIESLLKTELTTDEARDAHTMNDSMDVRERRERPSSLKRVVRPSGEAWKDS